MLPQWTYSWWSHGAQYEKITPLSNCLFICPWLSLFRKYICMCLFYGSVCTFFSFQPSFTPNFLHEVDSNLSVLPFCLFISHSRASPGISLVSRVLIESQRGKNMLLFAFCWFTGHYKLSLLKRQAICITRQAKYKLKNKPVRLFNFCDIVGVFLSDQIISILVMVTTFKTKILNAFPL